jgi:hypothetical protein
VRRRERDPVRRPTERVVRFGFPFVFPSCCGVAGGGRTPMRPRTLRGAPSCGHRLRFSTRGSDQLHNGR